LPVNVGAQFPPVLGAVSTYDPVPAAVCAANAGTLAANCGGTATMAAAANTTGRRWIRQRASG
jgi:hypothetical protein